MANDIPAPKSPPSLRCPELPLPPYRYIPGVHPHPTRDAKGHGQALVSVEAQADWRQWMNHKAWLRGLDLFDYRYYWECHEQLELIWLAVPKDAPERGMIQGLIQAAAYRLKCHMGHNKAAATLRIAASVRLTYAREVMGRVVWGVDLDALLAQIERVGTDGNWPVIGGG